MIRNTKQDEKEKQIHAGPKFSYHLESCEKEIKRNWDNFMSYSKQKSMSISTVWNSLSK